MNGAHRTTLCTGLQILVGVIVPLGHEAADITYTDTVPEPSEVVMRYAPLPLW
jgi:hypothetical protein